jgi:hypothetical protein
MKRGDAVLFLGAGASYGTKHDDGRTMPLGVALKDLICDRFLAGKCKERGLDEVASLAENSAGRGDMDGFVAQAVRGFEPGIAHKLIPSFRWRAIFGTNYDLLVETAFEQADDPLQTLKAFYRDGAIERELATSPDPLAYYKLHGTIDHLHDREAPLILTQESYVAVSHKRRRLFGRLEDLASEYPIVFVGTRLADVHIRAILDVVDKAGGARPTYYFVNPDINEFDEALLGKRRMVPIKSGFDTFLQALNEAVPPLARKLHGAIGATTHSIEQHFRRAVPAPQSIVAFLTDNVEHVHAGISSNSLSAELFFKGESQSWDPIERSFDIERVPYTAVMLRIIGFETADDAVNILIIRGVAGAGKTVFSRRVAYDLAISHGKLVIFGRPGVHLRADPLLDLHALTGLSVVLIVDQAADQVRHIEDLAARLSAAKVRATIVLIDTQAAFGTNLDSLSNYIRAEFEIRNLVSREVLAILEKLEMHDALGLLKEKNQDERVEAFEKLADRQLLVALYEATHGKPLEKLLIDEFHRVILSEAQDLYLLVCTMHRFNVPIRAGLVQRVTGIGFRDFESRFLSPLEGMVYAEMDPRSRDYAYRTRHPQIAEIVFRGVLDTKTKQTQQYIRIIEGMNPTYASDNAAMRKMLSFRNLKDLTSSLDERRRILRVAEQATGGDSFVLQQQALLEMNTRNGDLDVAFERLDVAQEQQPKDKSLKHTRAALLARTAEASQDLLQRRSIRNQAREIIRSMRQGDTSDPYILSLSAQLAIDDLEDSLKDLPKGSSAPADPSVIRLVEDAERALNLGLAQHPDFESLSRQSFRLKNLMGQRERGLRVLTKTLELQPHLEFVTATYARAIADQDLNLALSAVRRCLNEKPASRTLNQLLFDLMRKQSDDFRDELFSPLRRSFTLEDNNLIMHVHALRYHFMRSERMDYDSVLVAATNVQAPWQEKDRPRYRVQSSSGDGRFTGNITRLTNTAGSVSVPGLMDSIFIRSAGSAEETTWDELREGIKVSFDLDFNLRGPIASNLCIC